MRTIGTSHAHHPFSKLMRSCRFTNVASLSSIPVTYLEKAYGFWQAWLLTTVALVVGIILFVLGATTFIRIKPQGNVLPHAGRTLLCAANNGFKLDHAKPSYQESKFERTVPWNDDFVEEIRKGLVACKVMYVFLLPPQTPSS